MSDRVINCYSLFVRVIREFFSGFFYRVCKFILVWLAVYRFGVFGLGYCFSFLGILIFLAIFFSYLVFLGIFIGFGSFRSFCVFAFR